MTRCARTRRAASLERRDRFMQMAPLPVGSHCGPSEQPWSKRIYHVSLLDRLSIRSIAAQSMPLLFGAIADDFTGGLELASLLVRAGIRTRMLTRFAAAEDLGDVEAAVIGLKT